LDQGFRYFRPKRDGRWRWKRGGRRSLQLFRTLARCTALFSMAGQPNHRIRDDRSCRGPTAASHRAISTTDAGTRPYSSTIWAGNTTSVPYLDEERTGPSAAVFEKWHRPCLSASGVFATGADYHGASLACPLHLNRCTLAFLVWTASARHPCRTAASHPTPWRRHRLPAAALPFFLPGAAAMRPSRRDGPSWSGRAAPTPRTPEST